MNWRKLEKITPLHIALLYALSGAAWILLSDRVLQMLVTGHRTWLIMQTAKGWFFIGINAVFFYGLMNLVVRSLKQSEHDLLQSYSDLEATHEELVATEEELKQQFDEIREQEAYYRRVYEGISSGILVHDHSGGLIHANESAWRLLRIEGSCPQFQVENHDLSWGELVQYLIKEENAHRPLDIEVHRKTELKSFLLGYSDRIINTQTDKEEIVTTFVNRTEEKMMEICAFILNEINQLVSKGIPLAQIEQTLCDRLVEHFKFSLVWVGTKEKDGEVAFRAQAGVEGVKQRIVVRWDDSMYAQGAAGRAIRFGEPQVWSIGGNPIYSAWEDFFAEHRIQSVAAFPLTHEGEVFGTFALYSRTPNFFGSKLLASFEHFSLQLALAFSHAKDREHLERFRILADHADETILFIRPDGKILDANKSALRMYGYTREELLHLSVRDIRLPEDRDKVTSLLQLAPGGLQLECTHLTKEGKTFPVEASSKGLVLNGQPIILDMIRDISERVENRRVLEEKETRYREMFEHMSNAVEVYHVIGEGEDFIFKEFNSAAERMDCLSREDVLGKSIQTVFPDAVDKGALELFQRVWRTGVAEHKLYCFQVEGCPKSWRECYIYKLPSGELVTMWEDITLRKQAEEKIWHQAHHDALTDLPNRLLFYDHLKMTLARAKRKRGKCAVLFLDLDRFKLINDTMGHNSGDILLIQVAERLHQTIREGDIIGRQGGDEFLILLAELDQEKDAASVAEKILQIFKEPFQLETKEVFVTPSIGISLYPTDGEGSEALIKQADTALYHAKEQGRNNYQFYTEDLNAKVHERLDVENSMRKGLERREFFLYYQPLVNLVNGQIVGFEALIRWRSPERGLVSPGAFIPIAEETGLIVPIGEEVIREACIQNLSWQKRGYPPRRTAVNISARQFREPGFIEKVADILKETGMDAQWLEFEITESVAMELGEDTVNQLRRLKEFGARISIDDFGTGYSSLNSLRQLPIDILKIDQSFVREIGKNRNGEAVIRTIIQLAKDLHLKVIAEGVETKEQLAFLRKEHCDEMQGYLFSRPLPTEEIEVLMLTHQGWDFGEDPRLSSGL